MRYLFLLLAVLLLISTAEAAPSLTLAADNTKYKIGDTGNLSLTLSVPPADPALLNVSLSLPIPPGFVVLSAQASGVKVIPNQASAAWDGGSVTSNIVVFRLTGAALNPTVGPNSVTLALPDGLQEGEAATLIVEVKRAN